VRIPLSCALAALLGGLGARAEFARADEPKSDPKAPPGMDAPDPEAEPPTRHKRGLEVGTVAPPLEVAGWVNVADDAAPTTASLKGKVVLVEFWETRCGPCMHEMPKIEALHERYGPMGLVVVGICWEGAALVERCAKEHEATYPMGIDPSKSVLGAYLVESFPSTYVIGRDGKIAAFTSASHGQDDVERALGLGVDAVGTLADYLDAVARKDAKAARFHLERLGDKVTGAPVDLKAFATKAGGVAPTDGKAAPKVDGAKALGDLARARAAGDVARTKALLDALAAGGPEKQDLAAWQRDTLARDFPVTAKELADLLAAKRYEAIVGTILDRRPPAGALDGVVKSEELQTWCAKQAATARRLGRRGLLAELYVLRVGKGWTPKSQESSNELFQELSSSAWVENVKTKAIEGIDLEGTMLYANTAGAFVDRSHARALAMESLAAGKRPDLAKVVADAARLRKQTTDALKTKYGS